MSKTNLTISIDKGLLRSIKIIAAKEDTSISALVAGMMEARAKRDDDYEQARKRAVAGMRKGWDLGFKSVPREELHER
jgi:hypothetical protein